MISSYEDGLNPIQIKDSFVKNFLFLMKMQILVSGGANLLAPMISKALENEGSPAMEEVFHLISGMYTTTYPPKMVANNC